MQNADFLGIHEFVPKKYRHLVYRDEIFDTFIITKHMEIYLWSDRFESTERRKVRCYIWTRRIADQIRKAGRVVGGFSSGEPFRALDLYVEDIEYLIKLGYHKRRFHRGGAYHRKLEKLLAHKIYAYRGKVGQRLEVVA